MFGLWKRKGQHVASQKVKINVSKLKTLLGGQENILDATAQNVKVKIALASNQLVLAEKIQKLHGVSGVLIGNNAITIIVGNQARELSNLLVKNSKM